MKLVFGFLLALLWLTPAIAGSISFDFQLRGNQCTVVNRGDSSAYYPVLYQLHRNGQWTELQSAAQPAELPQGGTLTAGFLGAASSAPTIASDIDHMQAMMIRFFDQSGVSFGHVTVLRPPPEAGYKIDAGYSGKRFRVNAPTGKNRILATWVLSPVEEGIAPIYRPLPFTHNQPPATRIEWNKEPFIEIETGAALPVVTLVHETPDGLTLQRVQNRRAKKIEQRAAWLSMKRPFYAMALAGGICGILPFIYAYRDDRKETES